MVNNTNKLALVMVFVLAFSWFGAFLYDDYKLQQKTHRLSEEGVVMQAQVLKKTVYFPNADQDSQEGRILDVDSKKMKDAFGNVIYQFETPSGIVTAYDDVDRDTFFKYQVGDSISIIYQKSDYKNSMIESNFSKL